MMIRSEPGKIGILNYVERGQQRRCIDVLGSWNFIKQNFLDVEKLSPEINNVLGK